MVHAIVSVRYAAEIARIEQRVSELQINRYRIKSSLRDAIREAKKEEGKALQKLREDLTFFTSGNWMSEFAPAKTSSGACIVTNPTLAISEALIALCDDNANAEAFERTRATLQLADQAVLSAISVFDALNARIDELLRFLTPNQSEILSSFVPTLSLEAFREAYDLVATLGAAFAGDYLRAKYDVSLDASVEDRLFFCYAGTTRGVKIGKYLSVLGENRRYVGVLTSDLDSGIKDFERERELKGFKELSLAAGFLIQRYFSECSALIKRTGDPFIFTDTIRRARSVDSLSISDEDKRALAVLLAPNKSTFATSDSDRILTSLGVPIEMINILPILASSRDPTLTKSLISILFVG